MAAEVDPQNYKDVVLFLATAGVVAPLFRRLKISPILGFLGAGVLLGPFGLGALASRHEWLGAFTIANPDEIAQLAEFGVVFLLFMIGLELSWERLRLLRRMVFGLGALQVAVCSAVIAGGAYLLGQPILAAACIGGALALSSTAIVMPTAPAPTISASQAKGPVSAMFSAAVSTSLFSFVGARRGVAQGGRIKNRRRLQTQYCAIASIENIQRKPIRRTRSDCLSSRIFFMRESAAFAENALAAKQRRLSVPSSPARRSP